jgi:hypothetical protein
MYSLRTRWSKRGSRTTLDQVVQEKKISRPVLWPDALLILLCVIRLLFMLFVPPLIGVANEGDFGRILGKLHLATDTAQKHIYFVSRYQHVPWGWDSHLPLSVCEYYWSASSNGGSCSANYFPIGAFMS